MNPTNSTRSHSTLKRQAKDLYDRAARMYRKEPMWRSTKAALLSSMAAHESACSMSVYSNAQDLAYCAHVVETAARSVVDAESFFAVGAPAKVAQP